ncbi:hypothetical protein QN400_23440 [Pseudomonas sp. RTC3]|uniref:hypothetical protein n=1 Tax=unclassified Pseudomonas TaxID=196821 RepID=UPI002AB3A49F|nr:MULTISPECIES: hypothetical protein [unclassified Pseudomonas]MEB0064968.1 hypothetical protein [Pseudomonas sp. RTC3]MDY7565958.1 hypothetical protein [Pseudomonas sp. 5C2]MEB0028774.1 hypothetical protein [Pseudomonas sp. MH9.2]MEB0150054.1 hypothetical protein [Pseudomonas sp. CCC2.2]MEB0243507.1 hypothetical protein [Pseudomonas sp. 5C2]
MLSHPLKLIICIAVGVWLGFIAIAVTVGLAYTTTLASQVSALNSVVSQFKASILSSRPPAQPASENPMFDKYKQNLQDSQAQQAQEQNQAAQEKRLSAPKCQFWLQQDQTAPSEKTRANVSQFCG